METSNIKKLNIRSNDKKRQENIISKLKLEKLPFKISLDNICSLNLEMARHSWLALNLQQGKPSIKWCFSTIKKYKVFLIIFEANELGEEMYKEKISSKLPEYSYKTVAQIVEEGIEKKIFINLAARTKEKTDSKIRNIRPSEEVIIEFVNQQIDLLCSIMKFKKYE